MPRRNKTRGLFTYVALTEEEAQQKYGDGDATELYLRSALEIAKAHETGEWAEQASDLLTEVRRIEANKRIDDPAFRSGFAAGYALAQRVEHLLANESWSGDVTTYRNNVNRIRKRSPFTADDLREAERLFKTRAEQAAHLGVTTRWLRELRKQLLE